MRTTLYVLLLIILCFSCQKEKQMAEKITVTGTVIDVSGKKLDDVGILLYRSTIMVMPETDGHREYSDNGIFKFEFKPTNELYNYTLRFEKEGYITKDNPVDKYKTKQSFTVTMERQTE